MELEQQVCSLELAKQLKELRVRQDSLYYWFVCERFIPVLAQNTALACIVAEQQGTRATVEGLDNPYSAFTVAELGEKLSTGMTKSWKTDDEPNFGKWGCEYFVAKGFKTKSGDYANTLSELADTEADARAKLLIYLLENKLTSRLTGDRIQG